MYNMLCNDGYKLSIRHVEPVSKVDLPRKIVSYKVKIKSVHDMDTWGGGI